MSIFSRAAIAANVFLGTSFRALKLSVPAQSNRTLPSVQEVLKIDAFEKRRKIAQEKIKSAKNELLVQIAQELETGGNVNMRNFKELVFSAELEDLDLVVAGMKKLETGASNLRLSEFNTEAPLMRLFYYLNAAEVAYATFLDPVFNKTCVGYTSVVILLQLLYKNAMYSKIIDCVEHLKAKQTGNLWASPPVATLFMVSCLKLNTSETRRKAVLYFKHSCNFAIPTTACALVAAYCATSVESSAVDYCLKFIPVTKAVSHLRFNILMQLLLNEGQLVSALDLIGDCPKTLTQDTVDMLLTAVGGEGEADLKCYINNHMKVRRETLVDCLIKFCFEGV